MAMATLSYQDGKVVGLESIQNPKIEVTLTVLKTDYQIIKKAFLLKYDGGELQINLPEKNPVAIEISKGGERKQESYAMIPYIKTRINRTVNNKTLKHY